MDVPPDFADTLAREPDARRRFDELSYSNQRRYVLPIVEAKTNETRQQRIARVISELRAN